MASDWTSEGGKTTSAELLATILAIFALSSSCLLWIYLDEIDDSLFDEAVVRSMAVRHRPATNDRFFGKAVYHLVPSHTIVRAGSAPRQLDFSTLRHAIVLLGLCRAAGRANHRLTA